MKRTILLLLPVAVVVAALFWWLRPAARDYVNLPPTAAGPWIALGDSLTAGVGAAEGQDYPTLLGQRLGITILNHGRSGATTADGLGQLEEVAQLRPRVVLLCLGGNDGLRQVPVAQMTANLAALIGRLQAAGSFVVLIGIRSPSLRDRNEEHFDRLARELRVMYVPDMLQGLAFKPAYMADAIHPNEEGYRRIAERLAGELRPLLPQLEPVGDVATGRP